MTSMFLAPYLKNKLPRPVKVNFTKRCFITEKKKVESLYSRRGALGRGTVSLSVLGITRLYWTEEWGELVSAVAIRMSRRL